MTVKKYPLVECIYGAEKGIWRCYMDNVRKDFNRVELNQFRRVDLHPLGEVETRDNLFCSILEYRGYKELLCDSDRERMEKREKRYVEEGYKESED